MLVPTDRRVTAIENEMTRVRREFEAVVDTLPPDRIHRAPPDQWTPAQIVWHLAKVERGVARLFEKLDASMPANSTVPPGPRTDTVLSLLDKYDFRDRSRRIPAPDGVRPPVSTEIDFAAERGRWNDSRVQVVAAMRNAGPRLSLMRFDHPIFGPFDGWQWALMIARHEERHLLQWHEVLASSV